MDLKDFIANSLTQIAEGILQASEALANTDAEVNPTKIETYSNSAQGFARTLKPEDDRTISRTRLVERVSFDVAVSTEGETKGNAGLKVGIASFGLNTGGELKDKTGQASRIQFAIPMVFPSKRNDA
ncbi:MULTISPECIES: hypothetical protein [unclassified Pseudomonas]|uniref:hypothetical protein n=1 Tax=unclassified Pseudomonas TaxID=196821 RepID=UPI00209767A0|nr:MULTISPECIES: hypothetical protein [unclassified Pseudomonas]MCO7506776.1 hypothetical protein [Pseudomonas sp. VE 267-6A]MCO7531480.1 hypothetical protein [Pseudomonas sp. 2]